MLKTVTSLFDDFPNAAECESNMVHRFFIYSKSTQKYPLTYMHVPAGFLRRPHAILLWILKIYNIFVAPFLNPLLDSYIKLWSFMIRLLSYAFSAAMFISKTIFK
jgi:hypothetical protein